MSGSRRSSNCHQNLGGVPGRRSCHEPGHGECVCGCEVGRKTARQVGGPYYGELGSSAERRCLGL